MEVNVEIREGLAGAKTVALHLDEGCTVADLEGALASQLDRPETEVGLFCADEVGLLDKGTLVKSLSPTRPISLHLVCVEVHYEGSPPLRHSFPARALWSRVHIWACRVFEVASNVCPNLSLHADSPAGPLLNDKHPIGIHDGCKVVWLVREGPERNGR